MGRIFHMYIPDMLAKCGYFSNRFSVDPMFSDKEIVDTALQLQEEVQTHFSQLLVSHAIKENLFPQ